jgi:hypothetical protein
MSSLENREEVDQPTREAAPGKMSTESSVPHTERTEDNVISSNVEGGPSRESVLLAVALILTSATVAGLVIFAALASPA